MEHGSRRKAQGATVEHGTQHEPPSATQERGSQNKREQPWSTESEGRRPERPWSTERRKKDPRAPVEHKTQNQHRTSTERQTSESDRGARNAKRGLESDRGARNARSQMRVPKRNTKQGQSSEDAKNSRGASVELDSPLPPSKKGKAKPTAERGRVQKRTVTPWSMGMRDKNETEGHSNQSNQDTAVDNDSTLAGHETWADPERATSTVKHTEARDSAEKRPWSMGHPK